MSKIGKAYKAFVRERKIGEHTVVLPELPPIEEVAYHDLPTAEQYFRPTQLPLDFDQWERKEQDEFIDIERSRMKNGFWFFNNGKLEYITGHHYFYISWWKIKISEEGKPKTSGLPKFVDSDRDFYYLWDYVEKAPRIGGLNFITNRRDGKSYKGAEIVYHRAIHWEYSHSGIQSKTGVDAKAVLKKVVDSWKLLPWFLKPLDNGELNPQNSLRFEPTSKKNTKTNIKERRLSEDYINSSITYGTTSETFYDGQDLLTYMLDEAGKNVESDVYEMLLIVLRTMVDGTTITGKTFVTSTVEEMEKKGGANLKKIWDASALSTLNSFGMTETSLINYFKPAYMGLRGVDANGVPFVNKYGYTDWQRAKAYLEERRKNLKGAALAAEKRQYPFTIEEAFQLSQGDCIFDAENIQDTIAYNDIHVNEKNLHRGNFHWVTSMSAGKVEWRPSDTGKFLVSWFPDYSDRNKLRYKGMVDGIPQREPTVFNVVGGVDPFDNKHTTEKKNSDAAIHLFRKFNPMQPETSNTFVLEYIHRPPTPEEFWEDALKAAIFYSARTLCENNKIGLINYFRMNGFYGYLMERTENSHTAYSKKNTKEKGVAMNSQHARDYHNGRIMSYAHNEIGKDEEGVIRKFMPFNRTLKDWLTFDPMKWTDYDATVSSGLALMAAEEKITVHKPKPIGQFLPRYNNRGLMSQPIT